MRVDEDTYFSFVLPAVILLGVVLFGFRRKSPDDADVVRNLLHRIKTDLLEVPPLAILTLCFISLMSYSISEILPDALRQVNTFLYYSLFAFLFYIIFHKNFPQRKYFAIGIGLFIVLDALRSGMFTIIAYMGGLFLIILLSGKRIPLMAKLGLFIFAVFFVAFLQLFKLELRRSFKSSVNTPVTELVTNVITKTSASEFETTLFPLYYRMNQGFNIALVMRYIPQNVEYLGPKYLLTNFVSSFVPRLFWEDKPKAGGIENMRIYAGINIKGWSTNVGPIGEAYGSFGYIGGWLYMMLFAGFIRLAYTKFISLSKRIPILFLWMPPFFYQTIYVMESDSLQAFNSIMKGAVFLFLLYKLFPVLFGVRDK
ncbi:hypothetical protein A4R26_30740 [Niastella populi]|uniref:Oligosaccharide repeat unit polymerase n=2 Tax=Niastella populi TaxID=550983 RepID=A0A1V9ETG1_9BACT|nr:hypothetical protein A4R26_30740 [Niastella populi]